MTSPTIQPSSAAPAHTRIGKRSSSAMISAAPATSSGRDGDHVVEAHDDIGDGDDLHRPPEMLRCFGLVLVWIVRHQQFGRDVEQREPAHDLEPRQQHQRSHENGEDDAQQERDAKRGLAHLAPAARDHGKPRGRLHHLCDRTHWMSLLLSPRAGASSRRPDLNAELIYRRNPCPGQRAKTPRADAAGSRSPSPHPTISLPEKNCAISCCAVSGASEPCTEFSPTDFAWILRIVPAAAFAGSVAPMISRYLAMAFSPSSTCTTTGPEIMNSTSSRKNGRSR